MLYIFAHVGLELKINWLRNKKSKNTLLFVDRVMQKAQQKEKFPKFASHLVALHRVVRFIAARLAAQVEEQIRRKSDKWRKLNYKSSEW